MPRSDSAPDDAGSEALSLLIVDDHAVVREGLRRILAEDDRLMVVGEASTGEEAIALVPAPASGRRPDGRPPAGDVRGSRR